MRLYRTITKEEQSSLQRLNCKLKLFVGANFYWRKSISFLLMLSLILPFIWPAMAQSRELKEQIIAGDYRNLSVMTKMIIAADDFINWMLTDEKKEESKKVSEGVKESSSAPTPAELAARVRSIKLNQPDEITAQVGQELTLSAMPLDVKGNAVNGINVKWQSSNKKVVSVRADGLVTANQIGISYITFSIGNISKAIKIEVVKKENKLKEKSSTVTPLKSSRSVSAASTASTATNFMALPDSRSDSLFTPQNNLGTPFGMEEARASSPGTAARSIERPGSDNFTFSLPIASLAGRGLNVNLAAVYNSRVWHKSQEYVDAILETYFEYNVDRGFSPGFSLGFGYVSFIGYDAQSNEKFALIDANGTRHKMERISAGVYETTDGTFVRFIGNITNGGKLYYTDGTVVTCWLDTSQTVSPLYPIRITDRNGNYIDISYIPNYGKISWIKDTMGRYIRFYYDNGGTGNLVAVTVPGYDNGSEQQVIRFYYETHQFTQPLQRFGCNNCYGSPGLSATWLRYVYYPGTQTGFRYDYSTDYGMIRKITHLRNMSVSTDSLTQTGNITYESQFQEAASTFYNYPDLAPSGGLQDVPEYTTRTDDWAGRTSAQPVYNFAVTETSNERITQVTAPDGSISESKNIINAGQWNDGLIKETSLKQNVGGIAVVLAKRVMSWGQGANGRNHRVTQEEVINEAGQSRTVVYGYDGYNNITSVSERDLVTTPGTVGPELRRTETIYETRTGWINRRLLRLPTNVKVIANEITLSQVDYVYDNDGDDAAQNLMPRSNIIMYDSRYDPFTAEMPPCDPPPCEPVSVYDPNTRYRGNVTSVTTYANAVLGSSDPKKSINTMEYDIAGNEVEMTANCCKRKTITYSDDYEYAYPISVARGNQGQLVTSTSYDFNTGLVRTTTDENNQVTRFDYNAVSLRPTRTTFPNDGYTTYEYSDLLVADPDSSHLHSFVKTTTKLDENREVSAWQYFDGRGAPVRSFGPTQPDGYRITNDVEYDEMNRVKRTSNPYYTTGTQPAINPSGNWTTYTYDKLGRTTIVTLPDNPTIPTIQTNYNGTVTTVTDQAGRSRRRTSDALGRVIRVDEPDALGNLDSGSVPVQPTYYEYDYLDNLTKVRQEQDGSDPQVREFKYDSLSRMTHEKQVEADATLNDSGQKVTSGGQWTGVYVYDAQGLLTDGYDARGVRTQFTYDGLNRTSTVTFTGETNYQTPNITYTYDQANSGYFNNGRLTKVETASTANAPATSQVYNYDMMGRIAKQQQIIAANDSISAQTYAIEYSYNLAGQLISEKYPSGRTVNNNIDSAGKLSSIFGGGRTYASNFAYADNGGLQSMTYGNGASESFSYNNRLQLTQQALVKNNSILQQYNYAYGVVDQSTGYVDPTKNTGKLARVEAFIGGTLQSPTRQWQQRYSYDSIGRLKQVGEFQGDNLSQTYQLNFDYDRWGNRYRKALQNQNSLPFIAVEESDIDRAKNQFVTGTGTVYDEAGNTTTDTKFRARNYRYDANGRMVWTQATSGGDESKSFYDGLGQRVATQVDNQWKYFVYDISGKMVAEYGASPGSLDEIKYYMQDRQGSTRAIMSSSGIVLTRYDYQPFGEDIGAGVGLRTTNQGYNNTTDSTRNRYGQTEKDEETGLDHTRWRKYENSSGRWTTPDPISGKVGNPQSFNKYSYVLNDPINLIDPSGLLPNIPNPIYPSLMMPWEYYSSGFWGWGSLMNRPRGVIGDSTYWDNPVGRNMIDEGDFYFFHAYIDKEWVSIGFFHYTLEGYEWPWGGYQEQETNRAILYLATSEAQSRLSDKCLEFFARLGGMSAEKTLAFINNYILNNISIGSTYTDSDGNKQAFMGEGHFAVTTFTYLPDYYPRHTIGTTFNANSSFFSGTLGGVSLVSRLLPISSMYGLSLANIRALSVLHELAHALDQYGVYDDAVDPSRGIQLNRDIRAACGF